MNGLQLTRNVRSYHSNTFCKLDITDEQRTANLFQGPAFITGRRKQPQPLFYCSSTKIPLALSPNCACCVLCYVAHNFIELLFGMQQLLKLYTWHEPLTHLYLKHDVTVSQAAGEHWVNHEKVTWCAVLPLLLNATSLCVYECSSTFQSLDVWLLGMEVWQIVSISSEW